MPLTTYLTPNLGDTGSYRAIAPYDALVIPHVSYTCTQVATINGMVGMGVDVWTDIYLPRHIDRTDYEADLGANICIVTLQSFEGQFIQIPVRFLIGLPDAVSVQYAKMALVIGLEVLPETFDLSGIKQEISDLTMTRFGVKSMVVSTNVGSTYSVSRTNHEAMESDRRRRISEARTTITQLAIAQQTIDAQAALIENLQQYIITHHIP